ncbi:hypothetical protein OQJ13_11760 [Legionella sp. PATHC035]|uniref:hypothetical protein n=1 Tax=Legionella sp. PATHC035 TaxID=2992040 RepID=UPI00224446CD|nr:hypothetical protein [Legionella sp. PATHC035]MCW8409647.1 hypothetical protein [Legionella sp. PATHC035]
MKMAAELLVEYLEYVSQALKNSPVGGQDLGELLNRLNGRLFFTPSQGNIQIKEPTALLEILCEDKVLETFGELFDKWKPRVNETNLNHTKAIFYKIFFEPLQESEAWRNFWEKQVQLIGERLQTERGEATKEEISKEIQKIQDQIASAIIYRIQQSWLNKQNKKISDDLLHAFTESERAEVLRRRNLLTAKVAVFTTIINNAWNTLEHFLGSESNPEQGTIYFDFRNEMSTLVKGLETRSLEIATMKKGPKKEEIISNLAAQIHSARQGKGYRNLGEEVNEQKLQHALRVFVTQLMESTSGTGKGSLILEVIAKGILEDIKKNLTQRVDADNVAEYLTTIDVLGTIENKEIKKQCNDLLLLCTIKKDNVKLDDKSEKSELSPSHSYGRERTETISEPSTYSPPSSPRPTRSYTMQQTPVKEKKPNLLERFFMKKESAQSRPILKKNNSFMLPQGMKDKELSKIKRSASSFFQTHDDEDNPLLSPKTNLNSGLN